MTDETLERDAKRYRALRACFPVAEIRWTHDRFVLTTQEADGGFCTYQAATLQEFDDAMQEFEERAEYRARVPSGGEEGRHVCGVRGFDGMQGDTCPACAARAPRP